MQNVELVCSVFFSVTHGVVFHVAFGQCKPEKIRVSSAIDMRNAA